MSKKKKNFKKKGKNPTEEAGKSAGRCRMVYKQRHFTSLKKIKIKVKIRSIANKKKDDENKIKKKNLTKTITDRKNVSFNEFIDF